MIKDLLENKSSKEKANIKATELAKLDFVGEYTDAKYGIKIEIQSLDKIEGGIEIFARAWKGDKQLGFGADGTVDIERFRIFNPPILVPDITGDIVLTSIDPKTGVTKERRLREDLKQATLESLAHTIKVVGKEDSNIIIETVGNTTSTFYPPADGASARVRNSGTVYATVIAAADGNTTGTDISVQNFHAELDVATYYAGRGFNTFDTSTIDDGDIVSAVTFSVFVTNITNADTTRATLRKGTPADPVLIVNADYDQYTGVALSTDINLSTITDDAYNDFTGNSTFITAINKTGYTTVVSMCGLDIDAVAPTGLNELTIYQAARAGTTEDPKLVVVHAAAAAAVRRRFLLLGL